jgi:hypothetical protein
LTWLNSGFILRNCKNVGPSRTQGSTLRNGVWSVQVDWLGFLPAEHLTAFRMYARESESKYSMYSVALNEAIALRDKGSKTGSLQMVQLASDLCYRLAESLNEMFSSMAKHCRDHGTTPSVAALDAECFCRPKTRRLILLDVFIGWPLSSRHKRFLGKLSTLSKIVTRSCSDFHTAAMDVAATNVAVASVDSSWAAMDAVHYDLNTCFREMLVMWKCFLRVLSSDDLLLFQMTVQEALKLGERYLHRSQIQTDSLSAIRAVLKE